MASPPPLHSVSLFSHSQLVYFVRVAEEGQISRAARTLFMAQPALSQAIARLERQLGFELLERHPGGVSLTPAGQVFLEKATAVIEANEEAAALARSLARSSRGTLEIGFLSAPPSMIAPLLLDGFSAAHPDVGVFFRELSFPSGPLTDWLADVDVGLCYQPLKAAGVDSEVLWSEPRAALMHSGHALARRPEVKVGDLLDECFCGFHPSINPEWASFWTLDDHRRAPAAHRTNDRASNALEIVAALAAKRGLAVVPDAVGRVLARIVPHLVTRTISDAAPCECSVVWRSPPPNSLTLAFVETARAQLTSSAEGVA